MSPRNKGTDQSKMLRAILSYLAAVIVFGSLMGWSISTNPQSTAQKPFAIGLLFNALLWGGIFFNAFIRSLKTSTSNRVCLIVALAATAGAIASVGFSQFAGHEISQLVLAGWGEDRASYREYPIKGYELMGILFFVIYIFIGFGQWLLSLQPRRQ